jgi:hypothetical protein
MSDDQLRGREETDQASITSAFLGVLAAGLLSVGSPALVLGEYPLALSALTFALASALLAYQWPNIAPRLRKTLTRPFDAAATSVWCWMLLLLVIAEAIMLMAYFDEQSAHRAQTRLQSLGNNPYRATVTKNEMGLNVIASQETSKEPTWQSDWAHERLMDSPTTLTSRAQYNDVDARNLIAKSRELLQITRKGIPLFQQWQSMLTTNPERVCLGLDLSTLSNRSGRLAEDLRQVQDEQQHFFDRNSSDDRDLLPLLNNGKLPASSHDVVEFQVAAMSLERYTEWMRGLNDHLTCDNVVATGELATQSLNVNQALWRLGFWLGLTQNRIDEFQLHLRSSVGDSP